MVSGMRYADVLGLSAGDVVSIVGSGGKTSLLWRLAEENRERGVLVSTTTKMWMPEAEAFDLEIFEDGCRGDLRSPAGGHSPPLQGFDSVPQYCGRPVAAPMGVSLFYGAVEDGKISAPDMGRLEDLSAEVGLMFLECDGAKARPLKGWALHEPVVPEFTSVTIGVLPLWVMGQVVCEETVHRMPEFCRMTGASPGETLTALHLTRVISHPEGLFAKALGRRVLFLNDRGTAADSQWPPLRDAQMVLTCLEEPMQVFTGNIHQGTIEVLR